MASIALCVVALSFNILARESSILNPLIAFTKFALSLHPASRYLLGTFGMKGRLTSLANLAGLIYRSLPIQGNSFH